MPGDVFLPRRRSVRLPAFDYSSPSAYFLTICTKDKRLIFGEILNHNVALNAAGKAVDACWLEIPSHFVGVELGPHIVMPNHGHGIIRLSPQPVNDEPSAKHFRRAQHAVPLRPEPMRRLGEIVASSIPAIVRSFKSAATMRIRASLKAPSLTVWQRGYYEHVIRNERDLRNACEYIRMNLARWQFYEENP
jgi:putative transposase